MLENFTKKLGQTTSLMTGVPDYENDVWHM